LRQRSEDDFVLAGFDFQFFQIRAMGKFANHDNEAGVGRAIFRQNDVFGGQWNIDFDVAEGVDFATGDLAGTGGFIFVEVSEFVGISAPGVH